MDVKQVLYLSYDGMTDPLGQSQVLPYLIGLGKKGYRFTLISFEKPGRYENAKDVIATLCSSNGIEWHPLIYTKSPPIFSTIKDIESLKSKIRSLHKVNRFDIVHCRSYITGITGLWMKRKWGTRLIFDMRGFWADERVDGGLWNIKNPVFASVYRFFKRKEREFLENADHTITLTNTARKEMESWDASEKFAPVEVIPCCVDLNLFDPSTINALQAGTLKSQLQIDDDQKIISYIGSIGTWYLVDEMVEFFSAFLKENINAVFLFVTKDDQEEIRRVFRRKDIPLTALRIVSAERNHVPLYISISDYSIFFIKPAYSKKASSPTKQGEIMAMGIPVICNDQVGDTSIVVEKYDAGMVVKEFSREAYETYVRTLNGKAFNNEAIRRGAKEFFSLDTGVEKYRAVYEKIIH
ncbi:glycosyltransferase [Flavisolibacter ginsengisoli]|jgi:glycosyltransferase involved in cell wall biosynthesis|uniref:Glycosyltransferase involved in cell wall bisynthesis n=1 Tax=Flavisolibacter ginsengisoli DSM 18119 TaxID=1121884 RepID=A0A1M4VHM8_9BACT|nr:glycosyltransferase [Flavisolibacter ginsengisoli]SHE68397.1 Glycosyltransferase involved in cell wall bisynthesis [Flavisolibacter ginsengisoli DSM 18119]